MRLHSAAMEPSISISKKDAIAAFDGNVADLAAALGITRAAIYMWRDDAPIPERQALKLRYELRPDVFGAPAREEGDRNVA